MNPYKSPTPEQPIPPTDRPPLPEDELPIFAGKLFSLSWHRSGHRVDRVLGLARLGSSEHCPAGLMLTKGKIFIANKIVLKQLVISLP